MYYRYEPILKALQSRNNVRLDTSLLPGCPATGPLCKKKEGNCQKGDSGNCEQVLKVWYDTNRLQILYPRFVYPAGSRNGYFFEYDIGIWHLVQKGILAETDLQTF